MAEKQQRRPQRGDFLDELSRHLQGPDTGQKPQAEEQLRAQQLRMASGDLRETRSQSFRAIEQGNLAINRTVMGWLDSGYLGHDLHDAFVTQLPQISTRPPSFFERFRDAIGFRPTGFSPVGSSEIFVSSGITNEADRYNLVAHEQLHQASELGGGMDSISWRQGGSTISLTGEDYPRWLHEGMTELHAQQLVRGHGIEPTFTSYPYQTMTCFFIQGIVGMQAGDEGRRIVRDAYLTGDFTQVAQLVDQYLGPGSFGQLVRMPDSLLAASWLFTTIRGKMGGRLLSFEGSAAYLGWFDDPVMRQAMGQTGMDSSGLINALERARKRGVQ